MEASAKSSVRRWGLLVLEVLVAVALIVALLWGLDARQTATALREANYWMLAPAVAFLVVDLQLRAVRWRLLLSPRAGLRHNNLFGATNVGYLVNDVLPFRLGEVARVFVIDELERTGKVRSAASIAVERGIDVVAMITLVLALFPFIDEPSWTHGPALALGAVVLTGFGLLVAMSHVNDGERAFWKGWLMRVPRIGDRLEEAAGTLLIAMRPLRSAVMLTAVIALTALIWLAGTLSFLMVMRAFHLDVGFPAAGLVIGATTLGMIVPSSPGYIGVFHAIAVKTLVDVFGVPREDALTYAFVQHAMIYLIPAGLGAMFLWQHRSVWRGLASSLGVGRGEAPRELPSREPVGSPAEPVQ